VKIHRTVGYKGVWEVLWYLFSGWLGRIQRMQSQL